MSPPVPCSCIIIASPSSSPYRIPVVVPLPLPTPLATPPLAPLVVPVLVIPPLAMPLPLAPLLADGAPLVLPLAGVLADGTLLYLLGGLDVVGGCSTKDVSVVRKVASTSGGACCVGMCRSAWCLESGEVKVLARAKDCGVGAWRRGVSIFPRSQLLLRVRCIIPLGSLHKRRSCSVRRGSRRSTR
jgi:hypothetical protein